MVRLKSISTDIIGTLLTTRWCFTSCPPLVPIGHVTYTAKILTLLYPDFYGNRDVLLDEIPRGCRNIYILL